MSSPQVTPITGLPQVNGWAQVVTHPSRLFVCALAVTGQNANSVGKTLAEHVSHFQVTNSAQLHNALLDLLQKARQEECNLQLACILFTEEKNILAVFNGDVFLKRNNRVGKIISSGNELKIIEGKPVKKDIFVLTTHQASTVFPKLASMLSKETESIVPQLVADLHDQENSALSAMAWVESGLGDFSSSETPQPRKPFVNQVKSVLAVGSASRLFDNLKNIPTSRLCNPLLLLKKSAQKSASFITGLRQSPPRLTGDNQARNKKFLLIAVGLILLLAGVIGWKQYQINQEVQTLQPKLGELQQQFTDAQTLAEENPLAARSEIKEVLRGLEDLIAANQEKKQALKKLKEEYQLVQTFSESISGTETQGPLDPFFDLRLAEAGFVTKAIGISGNNLLALDASGDKVVLLELTNKQTTPITLEEISAARSLTVQDNTFYVLAEGIHAYNFADNNQHTQLKEVGDSDRAGALFSSFGSYLYVFNPEERNVYRYLLGDEGLSDPIGWLIDKQGFDFGTITSMAIDGDIWFTTQSGEIFKYTQGNKQDFSIQDLETPFDSPLKIATHPDSEYLFVLENSRQRLVILNKDGTYLREIVSESLSSADNLAFSQTENALFVISGSLVYKISL